MQNFAAEPTTCAAAWPSCETLFDVASKATERDRLNTMMGDATFWDNQERARKVINQLKPLNGLLKPFQELNDAIVDIGALAELCTEDASLEPELDQELNKTLARLDAFELKAMLSGPADANNAFLRIQAGAGGTDARDWAQMLPRMYMRGAAKHG